MGSEFHEDIRANGGRQPESEGNVAKPCQFDEPSGNPERARPGGKWREVVIWRAPESCGGSTALPGRLINPFQPPRIPNR